MGSRIPFVLTAIALALTLGCSSAGDDAVSVAGKFWQALSDEDLAKAKTYATKETAGSLTMNENMRGDQFEVKFGEVQDGEFYSSIETMLVGDPSSGQAEIALTTVLVREEGDWKVDVNQTMMSIFGGAMGEMMEEMSGAMQGAMEEMAETMAKELEESMAESMEKFESTMDK